MVRGVADKVKNGMCGFYALKLLAELFNPRGTGRLLLTLGAIIRPGAKDVRQVGRAVEDWESKVARIEAEFQLNIMASLKVAVLVSMIPKELQEVVFNEGKKGTKYEEDDYKKIREKVLVVVAQKVQMGVPKPMEVGNVGWNGEWSGNDWGEEAYLGSSIGMDWGEGEERGSGEEDGGGEGEEGGSEAGRGGGE